MCARAHEFLVSFSHYVSRLIGVVILHNTKNKNKKQKPSDAFEVLVSYSFRLQYSQFAIFNIVVFQFILLYTFSCQLFFFPFQAPGGADFECWYTLIFRYFNVFLFGVISLA